MLSVRIMGRLLSSLLFQSKLVANLLPTSPTAISPAFKSSEAEEMGKLMLACCNRPLFTEEKQKEKQPLVENMDLEVKTKKIKQVVGAEILMKDARKSMTSSTIESSICKLY